MIGSPFLFATHTRITGLFDVPMGCAPRAEVTTLPSQPSVRTRLRSGLRPSLPSGASALRFSLGSGTLKDSRTRPKPRRPRPDVGSGYRPRGDSRTLPSQPSNLLGCLGLSPSPRIANAPVATTLPPLLPTPAPPAQPLDSPLLAQWRCYRSDEQGRSPAPPRTPHPPAPSPR